MKKLQKAFILASFFALTGCDIQSIFNFAKNDQETTQNTEKNEGENHQNDDNKEEDTNLLDWPTQQIAGYLNQIVPTGTTAVIPAMVSDVEGANVTVNLQLEYSVFAINVDGLGKESVEAYKAIVEAAGWLITGGNQPGEYFAFWTDEKVKLDIYYEDQYGRLNIDVFAYSPTVEGWPYEEVAAAVSRMGLTGEVLPFAFENSGIRVDEYNFPPAIIINVEKGKELNLVEQYNQSLVNAGYKVMGQLFDEDAYGKEGQTLTYRATNLTEKTVTIELIDIKYLTK